VPWPARRLARSSEDDGDIFSSAWIKANGKVREIDHQPKHATRMTEPFFAASASTFEGGEVRVGSSMHDIAVEHEKGMTRWTHRMDPHIDRERDWVESDLLFIGSATGLCRCEPSGSAANYGERNRR
jgi:hypothetical protein